MAAVQLPLRDELNRLKLAREEAEEVLRQVRRETAATLVEVRKSGELGRSGMTEAARILGLSKPTVYLLLEDAEASP